MHSPILAFADYTKDLLLKQMLLRRDWEWYFPKNKQMGIITQLPTAVEHSQPMKRTIIPPKLEFLIVKWAIMEHFKEYLLYQPFLVRTDNNPLTYIYDNP